MHFAARPSWHIEIVGRWMPSREPWLAGMGGGWFSLGDQLAGFPPCGRL